MFATISGSTDTVRLLLEAGAKPDVVNNINRTAGQLGAFVGECGIFESFYSLTCSIGCYTVGSIFPQELDNSFEMKKV